MQQTGIEPKSTSFLETAATRALAIAEGLETILRQASTSCYGHAYRLVSKLWLSCVDPLIIKAITRRSCVFIDIRGFSQFEGDVTDTFDVKAMLVHHPDLRRYVQRVVFRPSTRASILDLSPLATFSGVSTLDMPFGLFNTAVVMVYSRKISFSMPFPRELTSRLYPMEPSIDVPTSGHIRHILRSNALTPFSFKLEDERASSATVILLVKSISRVGLDTAILPQHLH